jgi:putative hydrolase of the HAD superfamily
MILSEVGMDDAEDVAIMVRDMMRSLRKETRMISSLTLFDDTLPVIITLKERGVLTGVISNASRDLSENCQELGLMPYLDLVLTSQEAGAIKPDPRIFVVALNKLDVRAEEAIYVGDQYEADVLGARGAGISPILIDRFDLYSQISDCTKIRSLCQIFEHLS